MQLADLLNDIEIGIKTLKQKIRKEEDRAAKVHKLKGKAAKPHKLLIIDYHEKLRFLEEFKNGIKQQYEGARYVEAHQNRSTDELILLSKEFSKKNIYTQNDINQLHGLRKLTVGKALDLCSKNEIKQANRLVQETNNVTFYETDKIKFLELVDLGVVDQKAQDVLEPINKKVRQINKIIASGDDPTNEITRLIKYIKDDAKVTDSFKHRCHNRRHAYSNASPNYVSNVQSQGRIAIVNNYVSYLEQEAAVYQNGNHPSDLKLGNINKIFIDVDYHQNDQDYFFNVLDGIATEKNQNINEETLFKHTIAISKLQSIATEKNKLGFHNDAANYL